MHVFRLDLCAGDFFHQNFWKDACRVPASGRPCREVWELPFEAWLAPPGQKTGGGGKL